MPIYALPFTDRVVALFGFINPVIILTLGWALLMLGAMIYIFRHAVEEGDIDFGARKRRRVKVFGILLMLIGTGLIGPGIDATNTLIQYSSGTNNAGVPVGCTNSTIGTSSCSLPANGCDGIYRVGLGRCETASLSFTSSATGLFSAATTAFSPVFNNAPLPPVGVQTSNGAASVLAYSTSFFVQQEPELVPQAESADVSAITGDAQFTTSSFSYTLAITPSAANDYAVLVTASAGQIGILCFSPTQVTVSSVSDTQSSQWLRAQSGLTGDGSQCGELELWTAKLSTTSADTITVTYSNPGTETVNAGGIVSLYKGIAGVGNSAIHAAAATSDSVSITTTRNNEFLAGGSVLVEDQSTCQAITAGVGQTQRRIDSTNCGVNKIINYDLQDKSISSLGSSTFASTYGAANGDAIAAVELILEYSPFWTLTSSFAEPWSNSGLPCGTACTDHEIAALGITYPAGGPAVSFGFTCLSTSTPAASLTFEITGNGVAFGVPITGTASTLCNGTTQVPIPNYSGLGSTPAAPFAFKAKCNSSCGNGLNIELTEAYMIVRVTLQFGYVLVVTSTTTAQFVSRPFPASGNSGSFTVTFTWKAFSETG